MKLTLDRRDIIYILLIILLFTLLIFSTSNCDDLVRSRDIQCFNIIKECKCMCPDLQTPILNDSQKQKIFILEYATTTN